MEIPTLFLFVLSQIIVISLCGFILARLYDASSRNEESTQKVVTKALFAVIISMVMGYGILIAPLFLE